MKNLIKRGMEILVGRYRAKNLMAHLSAMDKRAKVLVVGNREAFRKYGSVLRKHSLKIILHDMESNELIFNDDVDLVVVLGGNGREAHAFYSECYQYKLNKVPVVFGINERALAYKAPGWESIDLALPGMFCLASQYLMGLECKGAYLEFGVFDGRSFTFACHSLKDVCSEFYAFDSFQGIIGARSDEKRLYQDGAYFANVETFRHNLKVSGCSGLPIKVVQGPFQETLGQKSTSELGIECISIVHIDSDIYEAAILALNFVTPCLLDGALILFDEFHAFGANNNKGERKAFDEWLQNNPQFSAEVYRNYAAVARSFIIHRN